MVLRVHVQDLSPQHWGLLPNSNDDNLGFLLNPFKDSIDQSTKHPGAYHGGPRPQVERGHPEIRRSYDPVP
jgi:hypothetical protein